MSASFSGTSSYLIGGSAVLTAEPITMACWFKAANVTASHVLMSIGTNAGASRWQIVENTTGGSIIQAISALSGTSGTSAGGSGTVSGIWRHFAGVFASTTSRKAYLDGVGMTTDTTSIAITGTNRTLIGARINSTAGAFAAGLIAEAAIWNVALTDADMIALAKGVRPSQVRPQNLVLYAPLLREIIDIRAGMVFTNNGSVVPADHPRIYR